VRRASAGVLIAFAVAVLGGISSLLEFFVTPDIRGWNRMSVFIAFFSLLAVALLLDKLSARLGGRPRGVVWSSLALVGVLAFGVFEQTSSYFVPDYAVDAAEYHSDAAFVQSIQARMPPGASIFQLPYVPYPEGYPKVVDQQGVTSFGTSYEQIRGFLHSSALEWSYGAMKGRPADWASQLAAKPVPLAVAAAAAAGFDGLWVEPYGYSVTRAPALEHALESLLGQVPAVSALGDLWFWDLRPYARHMRATHSAAQISALRIAALSPLRTSCNGEGLTLTNPGPTTRTAAVSFVLQAEEDGIGSASVVYPDGHQATIVLRGGPALIRRHVTLPPGQTPLAIYAVGLHRVQVQQATLEGAAFWPWSSSQIDGAPPSGLVAPSCVVSP
jgi:phosphoglycerol transferase